MKKTVFRMLCLVFLSCCFCDKNPSNFSSGDYELPTKVYTGSLTGEELLFHPIDAWMRFKGIFAADADGQNVRCLASYDPYGTASPSFLSDHRVLAIKNGKYDTDRDDIVIIDQGKVTALNIPVRSGEMIFYATALKGENSDKIVYVTNQFELKIFSLTEQYVVADVYEGGSIGKPAALPDGRIAYIADYYLDGLKVINADGSLDKQFALPGGNGGTVLALSDSRVLLATLINYEDIAIYISQAGPSEPWTRVTGFPSSYLPRDPEFFSWGVQTLGNNKLAYVNDDDYQEANPYFSVLVGDIVGSTIQNVKPIYQHKITSKKVSEGTAIYCLFWDLYN